MDRQELRETFDRVNSYRYVTDHVRSTAGRTLFNGGFMLVIAWLAWPGNNEPNVFVLSYAVLGLLEVAVGLWKKFAPTVECVLADAIVNALFGGSLLLRQALIWQGVLKGTVWPLSIFIGLWALYDAFNSFSAFLQLRRAFTVRPTAAQMRYVAEMIADIRDGDPEQDGTMLDFSREHDFKAQLLGDHVFLLDRSGQTSVIEANDLIIDKTGGDIGRVILFRKPLPEAPLSLANWRNYCRWKGVPE
jgi:hypothetical protein